MSRAIDFSLYLITDEEIARDPDRVRLALAALPRGFAAVQLRAKSLSARALLSAATVLRAITREAGAALYVNDRADVALAASADGVHLPSHGLSPETVRAFAPALAIGVSTHDRGEVDRAIAGGADFVTFGPVYATPSKATLGEPVGVAALASAVGGTAVSFPIFALGGIDAARAHECRKAGARIACIRAILGAPDPAAAARAFLTLPRHRASQTADD